MRFSPKANRAQEINWSEWSEAPFEKAQAEDKPVLLSISAVWCHWCHVMDETSFSDSEAIDFINRHYIPIRVDNDQRPDINSRYNMGGWPTIAFLTPQGSVITGATYMPPQQFKAALVQVSQAYTQDKEIFLRAAQEPIGRTEQKIASTSAGEAPDACIVDDVLEAVAGAYDPQYGGFGSQPKFPMVEAVELLLHVRESVGDASHRLMAENTLNNMMDGGLYDHAEGGFFRYSTTRDWSVPHFEKMLQGNVGLLRLYLHGHEITGHQKYASVASHVADYLNGYMYDGASGAFYGSQDADEQYYALPMAERRCQGAPGVDSVFYTGVNASVASAYLEASLVLDRPELGALALKTLEFLLERCRAAPLCHSYSPNGDAGIPALLPDYAYLVIALVDAYGHTSSRRYLDEARRLAGLMIDIFWDEGSGGFFDIPQDLRAVGNLKVRYKPIGDNVPAIEAVILLFNSTHDKAYRRWAETALSSFVPVYRQYGEAAAGYALAVHRFLCPPIEVSVVGTPGSTDTRALIGAALTIPYLNKNITLVDVGDKDRLAEAGYWPSDQAQAYVCLDTVCLAPIADPQGLRQTVLELQESRSRGIESLIQSVGNAG